MPTLFVFLFKVNIAMLLFCAGYYLVLRHLTFYSLNRVYLVTAIIFATIYPTIDLTTFAQQHENIALPVQTVLLNWQKPAVKLIKPLAQPDYWQWATLVFWTGAALLTVRLCVQLFSLLKLYRKSEPANILDHDVRLISGQAAPFSFWKSIYVNPDNHSPADLKAILLHEQVHVNGLHTIDILLAELSSIFYWFNPGVWLMKRAVRENIEFITDRKILNNGVDTKAYQYSLVNVSFNAATPGIVNHFNISTIKKRIIMMNAKKSSRFNLTRYAFVIPAVALLLVFSFSKAAIVKKNGVKAYKAVSKAITEKLKVIVPETLGVKSGAAITGSLPSDEFNVIYYINGAKAGEDVAGFSNDTESIYYLNSKDAKTFFNAGDGNHKVGFVTTRNSAAGMAIKQKIEQLLATHKIRASQLNNIVITTRPESLRTQGSLILKQDTTLKTTLILRTNSLHALDSLNYILNGKKISSGDFKKIDPNTILSVKIMSAGEAKLLLKDYDSYNIKNDGRILFVTTNDSEAGKKLSLTLGARNQITNIRINGKSTGLGSVQEIVMDTLTLKNPNHQKGEHTILLNSGNLAELNSSIYNTAEVKNLNKLTGTTVYKYETVVDLNKTDELRELPKLANLKSFKYKALPDAVSFTNNSVNRISDKLIVIDGKEATESDLKKLSAFDIDRMNTASDADTIKKYGQKAKYGVVFIYTKKAK